MAREAVTRWAQRSVATSAGFLVVWQVAGLAGAPRRTLVALALQGFVLHMLFGKAYSLVPSYFDRQLTVGWAPALQLPLTALGTLALAADGWLVPPTAGLAGTLGDAGALLWSAGAALFLAAILWTVRDNLSGAETATSDANVDRQGVDRLANAFVPVALAYLAAGAYATAAPGLGLPTVFDGYVPRATHLLAAGTGTLLVFAVGFRLLPRFMVVETPRRAAWVVLPAGALGPVLVAAGVPAGPLLHAGATVESIAILAFAAAVAGMYRRTDRDRVGFHGVALGAAAGVAGVVAALWLAFVVPDANVVAAHLRLNLLGFLGLTVVGIAYQFYPPAVGTWPWASDRSALASIGLLAAGLALQAVGLLAAVDAVLLAGHAVAAAGALLYAYLVVGLLVVRGEV